MGTTTKKKKKNLIFLLVENTFMEFGKVKPFVKSLFDGKKKRIKVDNCVY